MIFSRDLVLFPVSKHFWKGKVSRNRENSKILWIRKVSRNRENSKILWIRKVSRNRKMTKSFVIKKMWLTRGTERPFRCLDLYLLSVSVSWNRENDKILKWSKTVTYRGAPNDLCWSKTVTYRGAPNNLESVWKHENNKILCGPKPSLTGGHRTTF